MLLTSQHVADAGLAPYRDKKIRAWFKKQTNWRFRRGRQMAVVCDDARAGVWLITMSGAPVGGDASQIPRVLGAVRRELGLSPTTQADKRPSGDAHQRAQQAAWDREEERAGYRQQFLPPPGETDR